MNTSHSPVNDGWTRRRCVLLGLYVAALCAVALWGFANYEQFERLSALVKILWGAIAAVLVAAGVKARHRGLPEFIESAPLGITMCVIAIYAVGFFTLVRAERLVPIQLRVQPAEADGARAAVRLLNGDTVVATTSEGVAVITLLSGDYIVRISKGGYKPEDVPIAVPPYRFRWQDQSYTVRLTEMPGVLRVIPDVNRPAQIYVRSSATDSLVIPAQTITASKEWELPSGGYMITASASGYDTLSRTLTIDAGRTDTQHIQLQRSNGGSKLGSIRLESDPPGATVFIRSKGRVGRTPLTLQLRPGTYDVVMRHTDASIGKHWYRSVPVSADGNQPVIAQLQAVDLIAITIDRSPGPAPVGNYVIVDRDTGHETDIGGADRPQPVTLYPGTYFIYRQTPTGRVPGYEFTVDTVEKRTKRGF